MLIIVPLYNRIPFPVVVFILVVIVILHLQKKYHDKQKIAKRNVYRQRIIDNGKKIAISSDKIKIRSHTSSRSVPTGKTMRQQVYYYLYEQAKAEKYVVTEMIWLEYTHNSKKFKSDSFSIDRKVLEIKLYRQKEVCIYHDNATGDYFFDLNFLELQ